MGGIFGLGGVVDWLFYFSEKIREYLGNKKSLKWLAPIWEFSFSICCIVIALSIIVLPFVAIYYTTIWGIKTITTLDTVIIVALISGLSSAIILFCTKIMELRQRKFDILFQEKINVYNHALELISIRNSYNETKYTNDELNYEFEKISRKISLLGSPCVVKNWQHYLETPKNIHGTLNIIAYGLILNKLTLSFRRDLGQSNMFIGIFNPSLRPHDDTPTNNKQDDSN